MPNPSIWYELPAEIQEHIQGVIDALLDKYSPNINKIILFGSYVTGKYQPDSDIDIAVVLNSLPAPKERRAYTQAVDTGGDLDILFCSRAQLADDVFVYKHINEQGVVLYEQL